MAVLAVATARNPAASTARALAASHALGRTSGRPGTWRLRRCSAFAASPSLTDDLASGSTNRDSWRSRPKGTAVSPGVWRRTPRVTHDVRVVSVRPRRSRSRYPRTVRIADLTHG